MPDFRFEEQSQPLIQFTKKGELLAHLDLDFHQPSFLLVTINYLMFTNRNYHGGISFKQKQFYHPFRLGPRKFFGTN